MFRNVKKAMVENLVIKTAINSSFTKDIFKRFLTCFCHWSYSPMPVFFKYGGWSVVVLLSNFNKCFSFYTEHYHYDHSWHNKTRYYHFPREKTKM